MPNKYSHALVLADYHSRGLIDVCSHRQPVVLPYNEPSTPELSDFAFHLPDLEASVTPTPANRARSFSLSTLSRSDSTAQSLRSTATHQTSATSRTNSSVITQIYAPQPLPVPVPPINPKFTSPEYNAPRRPSIPQSFSESRPSTSSDLGSPLKISPPKSRRSSHSYNTSTSTGSSSSFRQSTDRTSISSPRSPISEKVFAISPISEKPIEDADENYFADDAASIFSSPNFDFDLHHWNIPNLSRPKLPELQPFPFELDTVRPSSPDPAAPPPIPRYRNSSFHEAPKIPTSNSSHYKTLPALPTPDVVQTHTLRAPRPRSKSKARFSILRLPLRSKSCAPPDLTSLPYTKLASGPAPTLNAATAPAPPRRWRASNFNMTGMSEAEIERLKRKGINPALKAEMDAATKGRKFGPLVGNTFIG